MLGAMHENICSCLVDSTGTGWGCTYAYQSSNLSLNITLLFLSAEGQVFYCSTQLSQIVLKAHLINNCNAPVEWLGGVFAWPIDSLLRKSWRAIASSGVGEEEDGEQSLEKWQIWPSSRLREDICG